MYSCWRNVYYTADLRWRKGLWQIFELGRGTQRWCNQIFNELLGFMYDIFRMGLIGPSLSVVRLEDLEWSMLSGCIPRWIALFDCLIQTFWNHYQRVLGGLYPWHGFLLSSTFVTSLWPVHLLGYFSWNLLLHSQCCSCLFFFLLVSFFGPFLNTACIDLCFILIRHQHRVHGSSFISYYMVSIIK